MKHPNLKKFVLRGIALCLSIVMCLALGACGGNAEQSEIVLGGSQEDYEALGDMVIGDNTANESFVNGTESSANDQNVDNTNSNVNNNVNTNNNINGNTNSNNGTKPNGNVNNGLNSNQNQNTNTNANNGTKPNTNANNGTNTNQNQNTNKNANNGTNANQNQNTNTNINNGTKPNTNTGTNTNQNTNTNVNNNTQPNGNTNTNVNNGTNQNTNNNTNVNQNTGTNNNTGVNQNTSTNQNTNVNQNTNSNVNNGGNATDITAQTKHLQGTTVTFAVWGDENATEYAKVIKHFTKKTKINVKWVTYNEDKYVSTIVEQNAAGKGPDIVIMNFTFPTVLETVQELPSQFDLNDGFWDPRVTKAFSVKGKNYFVNSYKSPFANGGTFVYYNKQIFSNNNIKSPQDYVNEGSWTWENLAKCVTEVNQKGFDGGTLFPQYIWPSTGSVMVNYNPDTATFSSGLSNNKDKNNILAALQYVSELCKDGVISNNPVHRLTTGQTALALVEHFGMKYNGWFKGISPSALGIVNIPDTFNGQKAEYLSTCQRGYGIGKNAKNIDGAYYVLRYFLDIDNYDDANADIFLNKNMERFYKEEFLPMYKTRDIQVEYMQVPLALAGHPWTTTSPASWTEVFAAGSPDAVVTALNSRVNVVDNAAKKATEKVQSIIK